MLSVTKSVKYNVVYCLCEYFVLNIFGDQGFETSFLNKLPRVPGALREDFHLLFLSRDLLFVIDFFVSYYVNPNGLVQFS